MKPIKRGRPYRVFTAWSASRGTGMGLQGTFGYDSTAIHKAKDLLNSSNPILGKCTRSMVMHAQTGKVIYDSDCEGDT